MGGSHGIQGRPRLIKKGAVLYGADLEIAQWVAARVPGFVVLPGARSIGVVKGDKLVAGVVYERCNGANIEASIAAVPGSRWADRSTLFDLFAYPFLQLGVHVITLLIPHSNPNSLNLATKLGFAPIAIIPFAAQDRSPLIILQMTKDQCRWINGKEGRKRASGT